MASEPPSSQPPSDDLASRARLRRFSVWRFGALLFVYTLSLCAAGAYYAVATINEDLPVDLTTLLDYRPSRASVVLATDGTEIGRFSFENRSIAALDRIPPHVVAAFLAAEDRRFYHHGGFDLAGIARAAWKNLRASGIKQGGSTITQQIIKQTLLSSEEGDLSDLGLSEERIRAERSLQKYSRKMKELILAVRLEHELTKAEILSIYLNHVYLGHGAYGVAAAADSYFGKDVEDLSIAEAAMLAGLVASPTKYAPHRNFKLARERQHYVLAHMRDDHYVSSAEYSAALAEPLGLVDDSDLNHLASPFFVEQVRQLATTRYGNTRLFTGGLTFHSTLDRGVQAIAETSLRRGLEALDRKLGFRGPIGAIPAAERRQWIGGPAHPLTRPTNPTNATSEDMTALADAILPEQRYAAMVVEIRNGAIVVDVGPKRLPLAAVDANEVISYRGPDRSPIEVGDVLPVRIGPNATAVLAQRPALQGSVIVMEPDTGRILALVGGYDWATSQFDRATSARRQVGSSTPPFIPGDRPSAAELVPTLVAPIRDRSVELVLGVERSTHRLGERIAIGLMNTVYRYRWSGVGPVRAVRFPALVALGMRDRGNGWDVEMLVRAVKLGLHCDEVDLVTELGEDRRTRVSARSLFHIVRHATLR